MPGEVIDRLLPYYIESISSDILTALSGKDVTLLLRESRGNQTYSLYGRDLSKVSIERAEYPLSELSSLTEDRTASTSDVVFENEEVVETDVSSVEDMMNPKTGGDSPLLSDTQSGFSPLHLLWIGAAVFLLFLLLWAFIPRKNDEYIYIYSIQRCLGQKEISISEIATCTSIKSGGDTDHTAYPPLLDFSCNQIIFSPRGKKEQETSG